jgi:ArsR family transcriptional regulator
MRKIMSKARLERLLESGLCECEDSQEHVRELKKLVEQLDGEVVKRQSYVLKALADATRIKILHLLKNRPMCTCEIMVALDLTEPNASHHLNLLERNDIVKSERTGKWIFYTLQRSTIKETFNTVTS